MKKLLLAVVGTFCIGILFISKIAIAEQGYEAATAIALGYIVETSVVNVSTTTATQILAADKNRMDARCQNISEAYNIYVGSNTSTLVTTGYEVRTATANAQGVFPIKGALVGSLYGLGQSNNAAATVEARCIEFLIK